ncbi:MAG: hypothetical protein ACXWQO_08715 [Bdellovibrionota bacterium]
MKTLTFIMTALILTLPLGALAKEGDTHDKVITIGDVYIPSGFDSSSDAFVVVNGWFPHSCYKLKNVDVRNLPGNVTEITTNVTVTEGLCLTVIIPFHKEVQLGKLAVGTHTLRFENGDGTYMEKQLTIEN